MDKEILVGFQQESKQIIKELNELIEELETPSTEFPAERLAEFSQKIDRIMGAAKTLLMLEPGQQGLSRIARISELCKSLGYKAAALQRPKFVPLFAAFWGETLEVLEELIDALEDPEASTRIAQSFSKVVQGRLEWLAQRVSQAQAGAPAQPGAQSLSNSDIAALLKQFNV